MITFLARGCPPGTTLTQCPGTPGYSQACSPVPASPPGAFSPSARLGTCYEWAAQLASPSWWTPWRMTDLAVTAAIVALALVAHFRSWSGVVRILLGVVSAWGLALAVAGSPRVHLFHVSLAAVIICGAMCVIGIVTLHMTREARP
jgi:hypothetical protein